MNKMLYGSYDCGCKVLLVQNGQAISNYILKDCRSETYDDIDGLVKAEHNQFEGKLFIDETHEFSEIVGDLNSLIVDGLKFRELNRILDRR